METTEQPIFEELPNGFYRYVRHRDGRVAWAFPNDFTTFHRGLAGQLGANPDTEDGLHQVLSAGFFQVQNGRVSLPEEVVWIDGEDKTNRSVGLRKGTRPIAVGSCPSDLEVIVKHLSEELL